MSKKMMRRSLALGALMAFVITGSAMAAQLGDEKTYTEPITGETELIGNGNTVLILEGEAEKVGSNATVSADKGVNKIENIKEIILKNGWGDGSTTGKQANAIQATNGADLTISNIGTIKTEGEISGPAIIFHTHSGSITMTEIGTIHLEVDDEPYQRGFFAQPSGTGDSTIDVTAETIYVKSSNSAVQTANYKGNDEVAKIILNAKNITLESASDNACVSNYSGWKEDYSGYREANNSVSITAEETLSITGSRAVNAAGGKSAEKAVTINLKGDNVILKNNGIAKNDDGTIKYPHAIKADTFANVTVDATTLADISGKIEAVKNSKINISGATAKFNGNMYVDGTSTLNLSGINELILTNIEKDNSIPVIEVADGGKLEVNTAGTLEIKDAGVGTYKVASGVDSKLWEDDKLVYDRINLLATGTLDNNDYNIKYEKFDINAVNDPAKVDEIKSQAVESVGGEKLAVSNLVENAVGQSEILDQTAPGAGAFLGEVSAADMQPEQKAAVINSAAQLAEAGGNAGTAVSVANNVAGVTTGRMSFGGRGHGGHKGGHGVGMFEEGSGAAVWAQYMHGKDDATDMPMDGGATSYESEYDGIVLGVDFKKVGKFQSGIAFNYGEGDSTGFTSAAKTQSDYDFWGIGYYGNIRNDDTNFIFDVNYAKSDSDVTQNNVGATDDIEASPETTTWSAGVKVEKLYQNESVQIVPYTGLRYMSIDTDEYTSKLGGETLFNYAPERQDIWLLPLGVTIKQEVVNDNGWVVTPKVDLSYIWAFGDTDSNMSVSIPGIAASNDTLGFTVMDDGSFLGLVGVEAKLDDWTFGVSYSYQKGDYAESKKWFVDAKYSF